MEEKNNFITPLEKEAISLKKYLDSVSARIRQLEASLHRTKTNIVFSKNIGTDSLSPEVDGEVRFFLSWELYLIQKKYRLLLIEKEYLSKTNEETIVFRKPLIECPLDIRNYWDESLIPFMNSFAEELRKYRLSL